MGSLAAGIGELGRLPLLGTLELVEGGPVGAPGGNAVIALGVAMAAALLLWEHRLVRPGDLSRLDAAFFTMNGVISLVFLGCVLAARLLA